MSIHTPLDTSADMNRLARTAAMLGYEIVDIAGFLDLVEAQAKDQREALRSLGRGADVVGAANTEIISLVDTLTVVSDQSLQEVQASVGMVQQVSDKTRNVAGWVQAVAERSVDVGDTLRAVKTNNMQIASIATQVNTLAINAKIEAARAGEAGRGFAVVADAINELSSQTRSAAKQISQNIEDLSGWIGQLQTEAGTVATEAEEVLSQSREADTALTRMEQTIQSEHQQTGQIAACSDRVRASMQQLKPAVAQIDSAVRETTTGIEKTHARVNQLIDVSEGIVQAVGGLGGDSPDSRFIHKVQEVAHAISHELSEAIAAQRITSDQLFDENYTPVAGSNPVQLVTRATAFLDAFLPAFQEPVLEFDPSVVFCAAVNRSGYLPVHNNKFSQPQGDDPVWNTANCRNRRLFDDRVGLKAGRNQAPFLLQVYRRDMGGGTFKVMKDLSAPVFVQGQHWGGLRLAYADV